MRVMHILDSLNRGGAEILALDCCRNAKANGLDLIFVATGGGDLEDDFRDSGVEFIRLQRKLPIDLGLVRRIHEIIRERNVEIVHSHQAVEALHAYLATRGTKVKRVLSHHLGSLDAKNRIALKFLVPLMDANIAVSQDVLEHLATEDRLDTKKNFFVLYNGVDNKRLRPVGGRALRGELRLVEGAILLGMVGNFYPGARKDQLTVCKSLPLLFSQTTQAHFAFIGSPSPAAPQVYDECVDFCLHAEISDRVHFLGKRADIPEVLDSLDIFVFSSLQEGLPIAVIEAFMSGLPCIVSDIGPLREVSGGGKYARLFEVGNAEDLARHLRELIDDPTSRARLGAQAREWAMQQFSIETYLENLTRLYATLQPVA